MAIVQLKHFAIKYL